MSQIKVCRRCRIAVIPTRTPSYTCACPHHDEDLYDIETEVIDSKTVEIPLTEVTVRLVGEDGNAWSIMGRVRQGLRRAGYDNAFLDTFSKECMEGSYDDLLCTVMRYVCVE